MLRFLTSILKYIFLKSFVQFRFLLRVLAPQSKVEAVNLSEFRAWLTGNASNIL